MKAYIEPTTDISFNYPNHWDIEQSKNIISIYDPNEGVGALQISIYEVSDSASIVLVDELYEYLMGKGYAEFRIESFKEYVLTNFNYNKRYWKYWLILKGNLIMFVTYNCEEIDANKEIKEVNEVVQSILLGK